MGLCNEYSGILKFSEQDKRILGKPLSAHFTSNLFLLNVCFFLCKMGTWVPGSSGREKSRREKSRVGGVLANVDTGPVYSAVYSVLCPFPRLRAGVSDVLAGSGVVLGQELCGLTAHVCLHHHSGPAVGEEGNGGQALRYGRCVLVHHEQWSSLFPLRSI